MIPRLAIDNIYGTIDITIVATYHPPTDITSKIIKR